MTSKNNTTARRGARSALRTASRGPSRLGAGAALLLGLGCLILAGAAPAPDNGASATTPAPRTLAEVPLHTGDHTGFGRVVLDLPKAAHYSVKRIGDEVRVQVAGGAVQPKGDPPRNVQAIVPKANGVLLRVASDTHEHTWRIGRHLVLDFFAPPAAVATADAAAGPVMLADAAASDVPSLPARRDTVAAIPDAAAADAAAPASTAAREVFATAITPAIATAAPVMPVKTVAAVVPAAATAAPPSAVPAVTPATPVAAPAAPQKLVVGVGAGILVQLSGPAATVLAADPTIARVEAASPKSIFIIGVRRGATNVIATDQGGQAIAEYTVVVEGTAMPRVVAPYRGHGGVAVPRLNAVEAAIRRIVPGAGSVTATKVGSAYVLSGAVATPEIAQEVNAIARAFADKGNILDQLTVLSSVQVNVRVRVAEVSRTLIRQLGINWQVIGSASSWRFGLLTGAAASSAINPITALALAPSAGGVSSQIGGGFTSGSWNVDSVLDALSANQLATILAEPNLTVQSGHQARFLSGGEYPIPVPSSGSNSISIEYKQYGVSLGVVPTVIAPNRISLKVAPEVSQLTTAGAISVPIVGGSVTVPALLVRRALTTVELGSGESFAIAGLLQNTTAQQNSGLPGLSDIPVLGALFNANQFQRTSNELVIIVTPYLVNPVANPAMLKAPTDNFVPATDLEQILFGKQIETGPHPHGTPLDAGFLME